MFKRLLLILAAMSLSAMALSACVTVPTPQELNMPLKLAFTEPVETLERRAETDDKGAQYALSFLLKFGLRDVATDRIRSESLRARAGVATLRVQPIYVPGVKGAPGSLIYANHTLPGISDTESRRLDLCGLSLLMSRPAMGGHICGSPEAYIDLLPSALNILPRDGLVQPLSETSVDTASVTTCEATPPLWRSAISAFQTDDFGVAATALDQIIALCGESQTSWHPRVMRALIAVHDNDPRAALAYLEPVTRPAPAPIGSYASFVAMQAQASADDWSAYARERNGLMTASLAALSAEPGVKALGDPFEVGGARIQLFERRRPMATGLETVMIGLTFPQGERDPPTTYYVTTSLDPMRPSNRLYFLDEYRCDGRSTLRYFGPMTTPPDAAAIKNLIALRRTGALQPASGSSFGRGLAACQFSPQVAPGLGDDLG